MGSLARRAWFKMIHDWVNWVLPSTLNTSDYIILNHFISRAIQPHEKLDKLIFKSSPSLAVSSDSRSHSGCVLHQGINPIDSRPFHSMTIRPLIPEIQFDLEKFKVKGKGQWYPSQRSVQLTHFICVSHQGILSTPVPFVPWQSGLPFSRYNLTLEIQGQWSGSNVP